MNPYVPLPKNPERDPINYNARRYTVNLLFSKDLSEVALMLKKPTSVCWQNTWNGCGGAIEETDKTFYDAAKREIKEETGANPDYLVFLGTQYTVEYETGFVCWLYFYAGIDEGKMAKQCEVEPLRWFNTLDILNRPVTDPFLAGGGNLQYYIHQALRALERKDLK